MMKKREEWENWELWKFWYSTFNCNYLGKRFSLFAKCTTSAFIEFASETLLDEIVKAVAERFEADGVDDLSSKGELEEHTGFVYRDASLLHIEEC